MFEPGLDTRQETDTSTDPGLGVQLAAGREMKDLTTRADKLASNTSIVRYDFGSLLQEYEYLQKSASLTLSDQDKQNLTKLTSSKDAPSSADIKMLVEITERFLKDNQSLPASDNAWFAASLSRLTQQQLQLETLTGQSLEVRRENARTIRNTAIDELRTDLPAHKVAEIDKAFPDKSSKEAVQKLLELADVRKKELEASYNAEDKKTLERINISVGAISKCDKEISECSNGLTSDNQKSAGQDQRNWYQFRLAESLVKDVLPLIAPEEAQKIDLSKISEPKEQLSAGLSAIRKVFKEFLDTEKGKAWFNGSSDEHRQEVSKFVNGTSTEMSALGADVIKSVSYAIAEVKNMKSDDAEKLGSKLENLRKLSLDSEVHQKYLSDGIPVAGAAGPSAAVYANYVKEQFTKIDKEFWGEMKDQLLNLAKNYPDRYKSQDGKSLQEIASALTAAGTSSDEIGKALWRAVEKLPSNAAVTLDPNTYAHIRGVFQGSWDLANVNVLTDFYSKAEAIIERRDSFSEQTGVGERILGRSDADKMETHRFDEYRYYCTEQAKETQKLLGLFAPEKAEKIKGMEITDPVKLSKESLKAMAEVVRDYLDTAEGKEFYSKQNSFIKSQIDGFKSAGGVWQNLDYDTATGFGIVMSKMIDSNSKLTAEQRTSAHQMVNNLKELALEVTVQQRHLYSGTPSANPQTESEKQYASSMASQVQSIRYDFWRNLADNIRTLNDYNGQKLGFGSKIEDTYRTMISSGKSMEEVGKALWRIVSGQPENAEVTLDSTTFSKILGEMDNIYQKQISATTNPAAKDRLAVRAASLQYELTKTVEIHDAFIELSRVNAKKILP